jgi:hypothetical protein
MDKNDKYLLAFLSIFAISSGFYYFFKDSKQDISQEASKKSPKIVVKSSDAKLGPAKKSKRKPASKKNKIKRQFFRGRLVSNNGNEVDTKKLVIKNKFNPNWDKVFTKRINKNFFEEKIQLEVKHQQSLVYVRFGEGTLAEKVHVTITREDGRYSSYTALVNSENGMIINTWNPIRYEYRQKFVLDAQGAGYRSPTLKK